MDQLLALQATLKTVLPKDERMEFVAFMGNADGLVKANKYNDVYVIKHDASVMIVRNTRVPNVARLPVIVGYAATDPTLLQVLRKVNAYLHDPYPDIPEHAGTHDRWAHDPIFIDGEQILPGLASPSDVTGLVIQLRGFNYYLAGWKILDNVQIDFTADAPTAGAWWVLAEIDDAGVITHRTGAAKAGKELLTPADIPDIVAGYKSLFAVMRYVGQKRIIQTKTVHEIYDMRFAGVSTGGGATSVEWDDILNAPLVFAPDLTITSAYYPTKWYKSAPPTVDDDETAGYSKADIWIDQSDGLAFVCIDDTDGAAVWTAVGGGGAGDYIFTVDGRIVVTANATSAFIITKDVEIEACYIYCKTPGTASSTIVDVNKNGTTIYTTQANRPTLAFDDVNGWASSIPDILTFVAGDIVTLDIDQIATGASDLIVALSVKSAGGGGGNGLTVTDGSTTATNVGKITVTDGATIIDEGGGEVTIKGFQFIANVVTVQTRTQGIYSAPTSGDGTAITPLDIVITPKKTGNKIILEWTINGEADSNDVIFLVSRNGTLLPNSTDGSNNRYAGVVSMPYDVDFNSSPANFTVKIFDEDSLDVETTYSVLARSSHGDAHIFYLNRTINRAGADQYETMLSTGMAMEINT